MMHQKNQPHSQPQRRWHPMLVLAIPLAHIFLCLPPAVSGRLLSPPQQAYTAAPTKRPTLAQIDTSASSPKTDEQDPPLSPTRESDLLGVTRNGCVLPECEPPKAFRQNFRTGDWDKDGINSDETSGDSSERSVLGGDRNNPAERWKLNRVKGKSMRLAKNEPLAGMVSAGLKTDKRRV
jgi:hypothetical protein